MDSPWFRFTHLLAALLFLGLTSGCATVTRGTTDTLVINSDPVGAEVKLSNGMSGKTPATFTLPRKDNVVVKVEKAGYEPVEVTVTPQVSGAGGAGMAGNVLLGGLIALTYLGEATYQHRRRRRPLAHESGDGSPG